MYWIFYTFFVKFAVKTVKTSSMTLIFRQGLLRFTTGFTSSEYVD